DVDQNQTFRAGVDEAYGSAAEAVYAAYLELFAAANLAVRTENLVLICHTLPNTKRLSTFDWAALEKEELAPEDVTLGGSVHSLVWGSDARQEHVEEFLKRVNADLLISGHIPCDQGHLLPNNRQIILDTQGTPACYCLFPTDRVLTHQELVS